MAKRKDDQPKTPPKPADLDAMIAEALSRKMKVLIISSPVVLGGNYETVINSLDKIADAELPLMIVPKRHRP